MHKVFVSYQQADVDFAALVKAKLEHGGFEVWLAQEELIPGKIWRDEIDKGIATSDALIVVMSEDARRSEYVTYEWAYAIGIGVPVVPLLYKPTELHPRLNSLQFMDFTGARRPWPDLVTCLKRLISAPPRGRQMQHDPGEIARIGAAVGGGRLELVRSSHLIAPTRGTGYDVFIVIDVQRDFCAGGPLEVPGAESLIAPLNRAIARAQDLNLKVLFARDWHPRNHRSFETEGGRWLPHCIQGTVGSQYHDHLYRPRHSDEIDIGVQATRLGYSPYEDPEMDQIINDPDVRAVYIAGIALEYCVQATARETLLRGKRVVVCESLTRSATTDRSEADAVWQTLERSGVIRSNDPVPFEPTPAMQEGSTRVPTSKWPSPNDAALPLIPLSDPARPAQLSQDGTHRHARSGRRGDRAGTRT